MNILFLTFWYPSTAEPYKGIFVKEHAKAIKFAGANITVVALNLKHGSGLLKKQYEEFIDENGIPTHLITIESAIHKKLYAFPPLLYSIVNSYIKKKRLIIETANIIHANIIAPCGIVGYWLSKKYNVPLIITEHWSKIDRFMKLNIFSGTAKQAYASAKGISVVSGFLEKKVRQYVPADKKIVIIPNVVNTATFYFQPKTKTDRVHFTAVATWELPKLPFLFVEALNEVSLKTNQQFELNLVGEGSQAEEIKRRVLNLNFKINFLGRLTKEQIALKLFNTDYFLHASQIETFSVVVAEALCTGTPVLASNVGALPELIQQPTNGILCINTPQDWVNGISAALSVKFDNKSIADNFSGKVSEQQIGSQFLSIYKD